MVLNRSAGAPCRLGHSHAIYNATDKPVQWLNINVSMFKDQYDAFNLDDPRVDVPLDAKSLDRAIAALSAADVEAVAVCFLHAWRDPRHEQIAAQAVRRALRDELRSAPPGSGK